MNLSYIITITRCSLLLTYFVESYDPLREKKDSFGDNIYRLLDWSNHCRDDNYLAVLLTVGMGVSDAVGIMIAKSEQNPNCEINISTKEGVYIIIVLEFPDRDHLNGTSYKYTTNVLVFDSTNTYAPFDAVEAVNKHNDYGTYYVSESTNATVKISSETSCETIKLTATTGRKLHRHERCNFKSELECEIMKAGKVIDTCISYEVLCDGNNNCGRKGAFDEDSRVCIEARLQMLWVVVTANLIMVALAIFFFIRLLKSNIPRVAHSFFIFNEDEDNRLTLATVSVGPLRRTLLSPKTGTLNIVTSTSSYNFRTQILPETTPVQQRRLPIISGQRTSSVADEFEDEMITERSDDLSKRRYSLTSVKDDVPTTVSEEIRSTPEMNVPLS